jgi:hypothetical protein
MTAKNPTEIELYVKQSMPEFYAKFIEAAFTLSQSKTAVAAEMGLFEGMQATARAGLAEWGGRKAAERPLPHAHASKKKRSPAIPSSA